jgi:hypothetical protein
MKLSAFAAQTLSDTQRLEMNSLDLHRNIKHNSPSFRVTHLEFVKQGRRSMIPPRKFQTRSLVAPMLYFGLSRITTLVSQRSSSTFPTLKMFIDIDVHLALRFRALSTQRLPFRKVRLGLSPRTRRAYSSSFLGL